MSLISQFVRVPTVFHLSLVKRILRYLKGSASRGIVMTNHDHTQIIGYSDSNWVGNVIDHKSTISFYMFVGGNLVSWHSKKQHVIACSSAEVEYNAMVSVAYKLIWLKGLLSDLEFSNSIKNDFVL